MISPVADTSLTLGHLALHYPVPEDGPLAARLLALMGLIETQMLPLPQGPFYRFVANRHHHARGDGIVYLSCLPAPQAELSAAIRAALKIGEPGEHAAVAGWRAMMAADYEASFHLGFLVAGLDELESLVAALCALERDDPAFAGRLQIGINRARRGDPDIDARLDASPVFGPVAREAYGRGGVQVFVTSDLLRSGPLGEDMVLEFDYVFPDSSSHILSVVEL